MLTKSQNHNPNYLAKIVQLQDPIKHPNADRMLGWVIDGNRVWTDNINYNKGDVVVYFPLECQINPLILSQLNLYSNSDMNINKKQKGFFDKNGRVRAIKLRGEPSEGFILNAVVFDECLSKCSIKDWADSSIFHLNKEFDTFDNTWICKKYISVNQGRTTIQRQGKKIKDVLIEGQFAFHYDTENLKKNIDRIKRDDLITISKKYHGTSGISANVLCKKEVHPIVKFFRHGFTVENCFFTFWFILSILSYRFLPIYLNFYWLIFPHAIIMFFNKKYRGFMRQSLGRLDEFEYKDICSSRRIIKQVGGETKSSGGYYKFDIWKHCHNILKPSLEPGISLYYEIVGYLPEGRMIQKGYDYGCTKPGELSTLKTNYNNTFLKDYDGYVEHHQGVNFKILIYRITYTTPDGKVIEYSWQQIKRYCERYGLKMPKTYFEGKVSDYTDSEFSDGSDYDVFLQQLQHQYLEKQDDECINKVPDEGIVLRVEDGKSKAYKLKSFAFLEGESKALDEGTSDIETEQTEEY